MSDSRRSASQYLPSDEADADARVLRVLWMLTQGMVWPWLMRNLCDPDAVERAIDGGLATPPVGEHFGYHLTDAGRARITRWCLDIEPHRDQPDHSRTWRAVTLR